MRADTGIVRFAVVFVVLSLALGWLVWSSDTQATSSSMLAVPVVSAMVAAVGFSARRKIAYVAATAALYLLGTSTAEVSGLRQAAALELASGDAFPSLPTLLYLAWLSVFPLVMLLLFVGREPGRLWRREQR